jgi:NarL family two-component system sensor histidine kinase YdfH
MKKSLLAFYRNLFPPIQDEIQSELRQGLPFYILVQATLAVIYISSVYTSPVVRQPIRLLPFTVLMLLHGWLHWNSMRLAFDRRFLYPYLVIQGVLAFVMILLAGQAGLVYGLFMALIGEVFGLLGSSRTSFLIVVVYVVLSAVAYGLVVNFETLWVWVVTSVPVLVFIYIYVTLYVREAQARVRAQELLSELEAANRQLSEYAAQVEDLTIANERQRMARELHDTLSQGLAGLILQLEAVDAHLSSNHSEKAQAITRQAMEQARATLADARRAIDDLRHAQPLDLEGALRLEVSRFSAATDIPCTLQFDLDDPVPRPIHEAVQRAVAEALTNIARYAQTSHASVVVNDHAGMLEVEIKDDGVGFDPSAVPAGHYGLIGMRERTRLVNGTMDVESTPGKGALLRLNIPLKAK